MIKSNTQNLEELAKAHYYKLKDDLIRSIENRNNYIPKTKTTSAKKEPIDDKHKKWLKKWLEFILISKPDKLLRIQKVFSEKFPDTDYREIFNYDWFSSKTRIYGTYELAKALNVRTCLYCNRNYTLTVIKYKTKVTRPQFDHFYYKQKYSLLALSFYNLIPSCNICNSNLKGDKDFEGLHPYVDDSVNDFRFKTIPQNITTLLNVNDEFEIQITKSNTNSIELNEKIDQTIETFKLKEICKAHGNEIKDLYLLRYKYSEKYLEELSKMTKNKFTQEELFRLAFGTEIEETKFSNRPLSKMKKDILIELGIIK